MPIVSVPKTNFSLQEIIFAHLAALTHQTQESKKISAQLKSQMLQVELFLIINRSPLTSYLKVSLWSKSNAVATSILKVKENVPLPTIEVTVPLRSALFCSAPPLSF